MKKPFLALTLSTALLAGPVFAMSDADDVCIDHLRKEGGPDGASGTILSSSFSEAGTLVMLEDAGGTVWRCIAYKDGAIGEFVAQNAADDGAGAMSEALTTTTEQVLFKKGTSGADIAGALTSGSSTRYVLGAKDGQFLDVDLTTESADFGYIIFNPDGSELLEFVPAGQHYRGQLWQLGDHVIEVVNTGGAEAAFTLSVVIE